MTLDQLKAQLSALSTMNDTQAQTIERYQRESVTKDRIIEAQNRRMDWLEYELERARANEATPQVIAEKLFEVKG